jgi:hypothetical protein
MLPQLPILSLAQTVNWTIPQHAMRPCVNRQRARV